MMAVAIPFGQYVPGDSTMHRLEPRAKIVATLALTVALFLIDSWAGLAVVGAVVLLAAGVSGIQPRLLARGLRPALFVLGFILFANALVWNPDPGSDVLMSAGNLAVSSAGLARGMFFAARIVLLVLGTTLLTLTTSPVALTDAIARFLRPLERFGFPSGDVATMLSIALRFIPASAEEAEAVIFAQAARGATFDKGGPIRRTKAYIPVLIPLFVGLFRRADDLALAMEARCYRGRGRTHLRESRLRGADWAVMGATIALAASVAAYL